MFVDILSENNLCRSHIVEAREQKCFRIYNLKQEFMSTENLAQKLRSFNPELLKAVIKQDYKITHPVYAMDSQMGLIEDKNIDLDALVPRFMDLYGCTQNEAIHNLEQLFSLNDYDITASKSCPTTKYKENIGYYKPAVNFARIKTKGELYQSIASKICGEHSQPHPHYGITVYQGIANQRFVTLPWIEKKEPVNRDTEYHGAICTARWKNSRVILGHDQSALLPINAAQIKKSDAPVIYCQDPILAWKLASRIGDSPLLREKVFITTNYGSSDYVDRVNFACLEDKDVFFIPAPTAKEVESIEKYYKCFKEVDVNRLRVLPYSIVPFAINREECVRESLSKFEAYMFDHLRVLEDIDEIAQLYRKIYEEAIEADMAINLYKNLLTEKIEESENDFGVGLHFEKLLNTKSCPRKRTLTNLISSNYVTEIVGASDSGKSYLARNIAFASACGEGYMGFDGSESVKVLTFDAENLRDDVKKSYTEIFETYPHIDPADVSLSILCNEDVEKFSLRTKEGQEKFLKHVLEGGYELVILDNFFTLIKNDKSYEKALDDFMMLAQKLRDNKVGIVLLHHTGYDNKKAFGSSKFESLTQNFISVLKPEELSEYKDNLPDEVFQKYFQLAKDGKRFSIVLFKKIKGFDELRNTVSILYHDKDNGCWDNYIPFESDDVIGNENKESAPAEAIYEEKATDPMLLSVLLKMESLISENQKEMAEECVNALWRLEQENLKAEGFTKKQIFSEDLLEQNSNKIRNIIQLLEKNKILTSNGGTSNKLYRLNWDFIRSDATIE